MAIFNPLIRDGEILNSNIEILNKFEWHKFKFSKLFKMKVFSRICFEFGTFGFWYCFGFRYSDFHDICSIYVSMSNCQNWVQDFWDIALGCLSNINCIFRSRYFYFKIQISSNSWVENGWVGKYSLKFQKVIIIQTTNVNFYANEKYCHENNNLTTQQLNKACIYKLLYK